MAYIKYPAYIGFFDEPEHLMDAASKAHHDGFADLDAYTPFPIHGLEHALGLKRSWIGRPVFAMLFVGATCGFAFESWTAAFSWPINVGGKPFISWPAYVPVAYECAILFAGFTNLFLMWAACRLFPQPFLKPIDKDLTNDRFALVIPVGKKNNDEDAIMFLQGVGANEIRKLEN